MPYQGLKKKVFSRYNTAVVIVFITIVIITSAFGLVKYFRELATHEQQSLLKLKEQGQLLNAKLEDSVQAILGMQKFANYALAYPDDFLLPSPNFAQEGDLFYLELPQMSKAAQDNKVRGNITGLGDFTRFDEKKSHEISMAKALTPAFVAAKMSLVEATWLYYISLSEFVNIYPWIDRKKWHYSRQMLTNPFIKKIIAESNPNNLEQPNYYWSSPYIDAAGSGLNTSLTAEVVSDNKMVGAVVIDINLAKLSEALPDLLSSQHGLVLINQKHRILVAKQFMGNQLKPETFWQDIAPEPLGHYSINEVLSLAETEEVNGWLVQRYQLPINDWVLVKYQPYDEHIAPIRGWFVLIFLLLLSGLVAFLTLVYFLTRKTFIQPATDFMRHIEFCAQGDPTKIKPAADWLHWFNVVENIFGQNRRLLQQLKEQNKVLDQRVNEKTHELRESSQRHKRDYALLRSVMNAMPELIIFNDNQGKLIGCNKAFESFIQLSESQLLGLHGNSFMPKSLSEVLTKLSTLSLQCSTEANESYTIDDVNLYHQGIAETEDSTYEVVSRQFFNDTGLSLGTINILRDVTKQTEIQSALKTAKEQAENANQAKNQFLANVSHEIRTPINAMTGMITLLEKTDVNSRQQHYLANAKGASESLLHLIDELLDLSKMEAGKMFISKQETTVDSMINKTLILNRGLANNRALAVVVEIDSDIPEVVLTDEIRLIQVISNLLNNAIKFTQKGEIRLTLEVTAKSDTNVLIKFMVKDQGIGISKDKQLHLFDAFSQADESMTREYGGSGLGLSICQQIVNLLGGEITLNSEKGQGSEFSFVLPFSLPATSKENMVVYQENITIVSLGIKLPAHFSQLLNYYDWHCSSFEHLEKLKEQSKISKVILLIDSYTIDNESFIQLQHIIEHGAQPVKLLVLCQSAIHPLNEAFNRLLLKINIPYLLLDIPLYRYSIKKIDQAISSAINANSNNSTTEVHVNQSENTKNMPHSILAPTSSTSINAEKNLKGTQLLLVEDNLVNQLVAKELLVSMGANVVIADNGEIALRLLELHNTNPVSENERAIKKFDVVLMDIQMPVMDGLTATQTLREQTIYDDLPIIAMTAHASKEDKQNCLSIGMNKHIAKPINADLLFSTILSVLPTNDTDKLAENDTSTKCEVMVEGCQFK